MHLLVLEIVFLLRVDPIPMLDDYAETIFVFLLFHDQPLHIFHLDGGLAFLFAEHEDCSLDKFQVSFVLLPFENLYTGPFSKCSDSRIFWLRVILEHPDVGVETLEVNIEDFLMVLYND